MGGPALFAGSEYQSGAIAFVGAHILAGSQLGWLAPMDDTPVAVWAETGGPGDDIRIELASGTPHVEVQAKHGLTAGDKLADAVLAVEEKSKPTDSGPVVIAVDETASSHVHRNVARDLERMRGGRTDDISSYTKALETAGASDAVLRRLRIVRCDVDRRYDSGAQIAIDRLERVLVDPQEATTAWDLLIRDAGEISARRDRRDRPYLIAMLKASRIEVKPLGPNAKWHSDLDISKLMLERRHIDAVLKHVAVVERALDGQTAEPFVWYRLYVQRASALLFQERPAEAEASARRALESVPDGVQALLLLTRAAVELGRLDDAAVHAERAVAAHPDDPIAWVAQMEADAAGSKPPREPPPSVAASRPYLIEACVLASRDLNWAEVVRRTGDLITGGVREPQVLLMRARALFNQAELGEVSRDAFRDVERLGQEVIADVNDPSNEFMVKGRLLRMVARSSLGILQPDEEDVAVLTRDHLDNPEVLDALVTIRAQTDPASALPLLQQPIVEAQPHLLAIRADLRALTGDKSGARADLEQAVGLISSSPHEAARVRAAMAALHLDDAPLARRLLGDPGELRQSGLLHIAAGRLAIAEGDYDRAEAEFEGAARMKPELRTELRAILASELFRADAAERAVAVFDSMGADVPEEHRDRHVLALLSLNAVERASAQIERALQSDPPPTWALARAAQVALIRADLAGAAKHLTALVSRDEATAGARIRLALTLLQLGRIPEAQGHLDALRVDASLTPTQQEETAELLAMSGRAAEAIPLAFHAARAAPDDPNIQRSFAGLVIMNGDALVPQTEVGPDSHVIMVNDRGATRKHTIVSDELIDRAHGVISAEDAKSRGLIGLKPGDIFIDNPGAGVMEERWTVSSIVPAASHLAHELAERFHELFGNERPFVRAFQFTEGSVSEFAPLIRLTEANREHVSQLLKLYEQQVLPLAAVASQLDASIADLVNELPRERLVKGLLVEWADQAGHENAEANARSARTIVLTRSALATARNLNLLDTIAASYEISAPTSLEYELRADLKRAEEEVIRGRKRIVPGGPAGFSLREAEPGDAALVQARDESRAILAWLSEHVRVEPRPPASIAAVGSEVEKARAEFGASSFDALALATERSAPIYADDLGLRRVSSSGQRPRAFSTVTLLPALVDRRALSSEEANDHLLTLVLRRYLTVRPSVELLVAALRRPGLSAPELDLVFDLLVAPLVSVQEAARVGAGVIRRMAELRIVTRSTREVTQRVLRATTKTERASYYAAALNHAVQQPLQFLIKDREVVEGLCTSVVAKALELRKP
jgi:tetratricopeptide (TPR) repeat protein